MDLSQIPFLERAHLSCGDVTELLDCYVDGEMVEALSGRFEKHLEGCESCRDLVSDTMHLVSLAPSLNSEPIPNDVRLRLRQALHERVGYNVAYMKPRLSLVKS